MGFSPVTSNTSRVLPLVHVKGVDSDTVQPHITIPVLSYLLFSSPIHQMSNPISPPQIPYNKRHKKINQWSRIAHIHLIIFRSPNPRVRLHHNPVESIGSTKLILTFPRWVFLSFSTSITTLTLSNTDTDTSPSPGLGEDMVILWFSASN